jgi:Tol biopolymer transport system component
VLLPFKTALMKLKEIEWKLGDISSKNPSKTVLTNLKTCANCHSFPTDGSVLAMDIDYGSDKGSYVISSIEKEVLLKKEEIISWSKYHRADGAKTFGLLSQISPDGRYVVSTVKDRSVQLPANGIAYSQLFFPIQGIIAVYDRKTKELYTLPGADNPEFVQSNPTWSPDGKWIVFTKAKADVYKNIHEKYIKNKKKIRYDLYRIPFNDGQGGTPKPLKGASFNLESNFFPKYSPDGKWIVFCKADSYMLLQEDSLLYIMPADGGQAKLMSSNHPGTMNSWHSFSPNGKWLVFASKINGPYTQLWLTHIDSKGKDSPPILLENFISEKRAANIPEFVNIEKEKMQMIRQDIFKNKPKK